MVPLDKFPTVKALPYLSAISLIEDGDILLVNGSGFISDAVSVGTSSIWTHCAFVVNVPLFDRLMVFESYYQVRLIPLHDYFDSTDIQKSTGRFLIARHKGFNPHMVSTLASTASDILGHPYNYSHLFKIAARIALDVAGMGLKTPINPDNAYICSEYLWTCYKACGIDLNRNVDGFVAPSDIASSALLEPIVEIV